MRDDQKLRVTFETKDAQTSILLSGSGVIRCDLIVAGRGDGTPQTNGRSA